MSTNEPEEPARLLTPESGASPRLRAALESARSDEPSAAALAALAARVGVATGVAVVAGGGAATSGGTGAGGAAASGAGVATGVVAKVVVGGLLVGLIGVGGWVFGGAEAPEGVAVVDVPVTEVPAVDVPVVPEVPVVEAPVAEAPTVPTVALPAVAKVPAAPKQPEEKVAAEVHTSAPETPAAAPTVDLNAELDLVRTAQRALKGDPAAALAACETHVARFPEGSMAQEREVLAIQALVALGRMDEARSRGDAFAVRWPGSAHLRRIAVVVGG